MTEEINRYNLEEGSSLGDIVTTLQAMIAEGRAEERVEVNARRADDEKGQTLAGPVREVYPVILQITREEVDKEIASVGTKVAQAKLALSAHNRALVAADDPITPAHEAQIQAWLGKVGARAVSLRRELLATGEFAPQLEQLDGQIAEIASLVTEPLDQPESGAGKIRVLKEHRVARDAHEIRDLPLRDKVARIDTGLTGGADVDLDRKAFQELNAETKQAIATITGKPLIKAVEEVLDEAFPDMMKAFYPKVYENTGRYHSPRAMAAMMANVVAEMLRYGYHRSATAYRLMMPGLAYMKERRMPLFFLAPDLMEAVLRTDFDDDIDWTTLDLPYESGALMLPKGSLVHPEDGEVAMIMWSRVRKGEHAPPWPGIPITVLPNDAFVLLGACPESMIWYDSILTSNVRRVMRLHNLFYRAPGEAAPAIKKSNFLDDDLTEQDSGFVEKMGCILFGTFLAMNARPMLVERGQLIKRVGKAEKMREFWSPNVIGARYKFKREVPRVIDRKFVSTPHVSGTHASPRLHWRRGHYRNQPVGPGRKERKHIWIEPCLIGAEA